MPVPPVNYCVSERIALLCSMRATLYQDEVSSHIVKVASGRRLREMEKYQGLDTAID
jgi:hypothetical protein